jgi:hypothetical protein
LHFRCCHILFAPNRDDDAEKVLYIADDFARRHPATSYPIKLEPEKNPLGKMVLGMLWLLCLDNLLPKDAHSLSYFFSATEPFPAA